MDKIKLKLMIKIEIGLEKCISTPKSKKTTTQV